MAGDTPHELAERLWSRVVRDRAFLAAASDDLLVCIVDRDGLENDWIESARPADRPPAGSHPLNLRKHSSKRIAQTDAITAAAATRATYRSTRVQIDWIAVIAVDAAQDVGYFARLEPDSDGALIVEARADWLAFRPAPFAAADVTQVLAPAREALLHMLRQGLDDAAKQRRRRLRRR